MPNDPIMLLSFINTKLRDEYSDLSELCASENISRDEINQKLNAVNYFYDEVLNKFV
jgi:hypothetical protein